MSRIITLKLYVTNLQFFLKRRVGKKISCNQFLTLNNIYYVLLSKMCLMNRNFN